MGGKGSGRKPQPCGTTAAYQRHRKKGEEACRACKDAMRDAHRRRHGYKNKAKKWLNNNERMRTMRQIANEAITQEKLHRGKCADCERSCTIDNLIAFDFDHLEPAQKAFAISGWTNKQDLRELHDEMAKCDLVCAYCHRLRTFAAGHQHLGNQPKAQAPTLFEAAS